MKRQFGLLCAVGMAAAGAVGCQSAPMWLPSVGGAMSAPVPTGRAAEPPKSTPATWPLAAGSIFRTELSGGGVALTTRLDGSTMQTTMPNGTIFLTTTRTLPDGSTARTTERAPAGKEPELPPLLAAAKAGLRSEVESLLRNGAPIDQKGPGGETALHWASAYDQATTVELLLTPFFLAMYGADVDAKAGDGTTALHMASEEGHEEIVKALLAHSAEPNARNDDGVTPLHLATANGHVQVIEFLATHGAELNTQDDLGSTPLHLAAAYGQAPAVEVLLRRGADAAIADEDGKTPLDLAVANEHQKTAKCFSASGATGRDAASPIPEGVYAGEISFSVELGFATPTETGREIEEFTFGPGGLINGSGPLRRGTTDGQLSADDGRGLETRVIVVGVYADTTSLRIDYDATFIFRGEQPITKRGSATYTLNADGTVRRETELGGGVSHGVLTRSDGTRHMPKVAEEEKATAPSGAGWAAIPGIFLVVILVVVLGKRRERFRRRRHLTQGLTTGLRAEGLGSG